jgi:hypothetical protein
MLRYGSWLSFDHLIPPTGLFWLVNPVQNLRVDARAFHPGKQQPFTAMRANDAGPNLSLRVFTRRHPQFPLHDRLGTADDVEDLTAPKEAGDHALLKRAVFGWYISAKQTHNGSHRRSIDPGIGEVG